MALCNPIYRNAIIMQKYIIYNVAKDGACLYRCMAKYLYDQYRKNVHLRQIIDCNFNSELFDISQHYDFDVETAIARALQILLVQWVIEDAETASLVEICHNLPINIYSEIYQIFAGDVDYIYTNIGCEKPKKVKIPTRWGALPEQIAFNRIFGVAINIYTLHQRRTTKINMDNVKHIMTVDAAGQSGVLNLLLTETKASHYMLIAMEE
jgi:hypothetical protein